MKEVYSIEAHDRNVTKMQHNITNGRI